MASKVVAPKETPLEDFVLADPTGNEWFDWRDCLVLDCEANGLLDKGDDYRMHCCWIFDMRTRQWHGFRPDQLREMFALMEGRVVIAHNGLGYDFQAFEVVAAQLGVEYKPALEVDTLVLVRMLWAVDDLIEPDARLWKKGLMPGNKMKAQGIEAWGYRLGVMKGDYSDIKKAEYLAAGGDKADRAAMMDYVWGTFNEEMYDYNKQDVVVLLKLLLLIFKKLGWFQPTIEGKPPVYSYPALPVETEHLMQRICLHQEYRGLGFNRDRAIGLASELANMAAELEEMVSSAFAPWWQASPVKKATRTIRRRVRELPQVTIRRWSDKTGKELASEFDHPWATTDEGNSYQDIKRMQFNLSNRHHLAARLVAQYGWKPRAFGGAKGTDPVIDEATIKAIPDKVLSAPMKKAILDYYVITKTYATLTGGTNAWMRLYDEVTGTIHGRCNPLGTITHRAAHDKPNLGNIPSVELDEEKDDSGKVVAKTAIVGVEGGFGHECRELFGPASPFDTESGTDVYALEVFTLGHYLYKFDGGLLARKLEDPDYDIHQDNANICGLARKDVKTTFYKTLYGSGALDVGRDVWKDEDKDDDWVDAPGVKQWLRFTQERLGDLFKMPSKHEKALYGKGRHYQQKLLNGVPGLKDLRADVNAAGSRGYIRAIDGRRLSVRKEFATLNTLLQGSGSLICKMWIIETHRMLKAQGLKPSVLEPGTGRILVANDYNQIAWVHDETQWEHMASLGSVIGETAERAIKEVTPKLGLRVTLRTDHKEGRNWADCH